MQSCDRLYDTEIRKVTCATNAIESPNARSRCAVRARGHFPDEQSVATIAGHRFAELPNADFRAAASALGVPRNLS